MIIKAAKRLFNSDKICRSYSDLNFFWRHFFGTQCISPLSLKHLDIVYVSQNFRIPITYVHQSGSWMRFLGGGI